MTVYHAALMSCRGAPPPGRVVSAAAAHPAERSLPPSAVPAMHTLPAVKSVEDPNVNAPGLNGLTVNGTQALETGTFTVSAVQPIQYTVREVPGLLDPANEVCTPPLHRALQNHPVAMQH